MSKMTGRFEAWMTGLIWVAATVLLPMAALTPIDGSGRVEAKATSCVRVAVDILRTCPATSL